jgi:hypothetical protein
MIYFDENKNAYGYEIENPITVIEDDVWVVYAGTDKWDIIDGIFTDITDTEEYKAKQAQAEKERIQELSMTRSDFFDGTIQAWGVGQDELLVLIQALLATLPLPDVKKLIAINNYKNALNFYRKHDLFKMLVGMPIKLGDNIQLVIEDEHLDKFFDEVNKGNKETAWQYLPAPVMIPIEESVEEPEEIIEEVGEVEEIENVSSAADIIE